MPFSEGAMVINDYPEKYFVVGSVGAIGDSGINSAIPELKILSPAIGFDNSVHEQWISVLDTNRGIQLLIRSMNYFRANHIDDSGKFSMIRN